jgi:hypothetical protein
MTIFKEATALFLVTISLLASCKTESPPKIILEMEASLVEQKKEFSRQIACMEWYLENNKAVNEECNFNPVEILESSRMLLKDIRNEMSERERFIILFRVDLKKTASSEVFNPITRLNPNYIVAFRHHIRIELGGMENHFGYFVYDEGYRHENGPFAREILPGLWCYGEEKKK